jgi:3-O-methylgallate 3,4-dioxygenase
VFVAEITFGLGTSHTPQLSVPPADWEQFAEVDHSRPNLLGLDGEFHTYAEVLAAVPRDLSDELAPEVWEAKHTRVQQAIASLHDTVAAAGIDVAIIIGDDQNEFFRGGNNPMFAVYCGDGVEEIPRSEESLAQAAAVVRKAQWAMHGEQPERYATAPTLAEHLVTRLVEADFDVNYLKTQPAGQSLGHAFTFIRRRVMGDALVPLVPVMINTYFPPNTPSPRRCYRLGEAIAAAVRSWPGVERVGIFASGGLSHVVVDERLDTRILEAMRKKDGEALMALERRRLRVGTSESLNWIAAAGALTGLDMQLVDYVPLYRSPAGTGVGATFAYWQ